MTVIVIEEKGKPMANNQINNEYVQKGYLKTYLANRDIKVISYDEWEHLCDCIDDAKAADVVSKNTYNQVKWERDTVIKQLEDLGYGFGEEVRDINRLKDEVGMMSEGW